METSPEASHSRAFEVSLENFSGPFDLLLSLIAKHQLDVTEVALAQVTDEFISYISAQEWDLSVASEFLVIAATLLELKAARLIPGNDEEIEDLELLEARDLLFARLLQYKAYKEVAGELGVRLIREGRSVPRSGGLEPQFSALLPELVMSITPEQLAALAARALARPPAPTEVGLTHLHSPTVNVREQTALVVALLRRRRRASFRELVRDTEILGEVVARFLGLLDLFRRQQVSFDQVAPLGDLTITWIGGETRVDLDDSEFDTQDDPATGEDANSGSTVLEPDTPQKARRGHE